MKIVHIFLSLCDCSIGKLFIIYVAELSVRSWFAPQTTNTTLATPHVVASYISGDKGLG